MKLSIAFLACVERGPLEAQTVLLCRSIRCHAGRFRNAPIHTFQPRNGTTISTTTHRVLKELDVVHHTLALNTALPNYGMGNKVFVGAWAEKHIDADVLVFLDSDTVVLGEPSALALPEDIPAAARPANSTRLNSAGPQHPMDPYWMSVYDCCRIEDEPYVKTETGRQVRAYFSAGLVAVRREAALFQRWETLLLRLVGANLFPPETGLARMDEVSLAVTLIPQFSNLRLLDDRYNYLIFRRSRLPSPWREAQLEDLVHVHYRQSFSIPDFLDRLEPPLLPGSSLRRWLDQHIPLPTDDA